MTMRKLVTAAVMMHFFSGRLMHFYSGVDTRCITEPARLR